jgi:hypothetical protein
MRAFVAWPEEQFVQQFAAQTFWYHTLLTTEDAEKRIDHRFHR